MTIKETKLCRECGKEYPASEFASTWKNGTYTHTKCKECRKKGYRIAQKSKQRTTQPWELIY